MIYDSYLEASAHHSVSARLLTNSSATWPVHRMKREVKNILVGTACVSKKQHQQK